MRLVDKPVTRPHHCAAIPHIGQTHQTARWIDCAEMNGFDNRVYLSDIAVIEAGKLFGFPSPEEHDALLKDRDRLADEVEKVTAELETLRERFEAIDVLASADFRARKKPGRKTPKPTEEVAA